MGYFTDINNSSNRAQGVAEYNRANGVNGHTALGVIASQYGPSIFMSLTSKIASSSDGKGGSDSKELSIDEQKKSLEKQLDKALKLAGADSITSDADVENIKNDAEKTRQNNIQNSEVVKNITKFQANTDDYSNKINDLKTQLNSSTITEEEKTNINKQIKKLEDQKTKAFNKLQKEYSELVKTEDKKLQDIVFNADKAKNIYIQLQSLKAINDSDKVEPKYDVKQEVTDLSDFNKAREKFLKKPSKETAVALEEAFKSVDSEKTKEAYNKYLEPKIKKYLNN